MSSPTDPLLPFHPLVAQWFRERVGTPTDVQARAWPEIAAGRHALAVAPTGSGKTLTAFLWALDRLLTGAWVGGRLRVLYVSPLKALNADIERNLARPLAELAARFEAAGHPFPAVRVATRSGDTPREARQRLLRHPPEILITTPESLNLLLTSKAARTLFADLATVILDEIHAVAASKRGTHLMTAVERLTLEAGEFQRIALSATVCPLERVAELVGGARWNGETEAPRYERRAVAVVRSPVAKRYDVAVRFPAGATGEEEGSGFWDLLTPELRAEVRKHRSTLVFTNSRRMAEKVTRFLNEGAGPELATSHHGSLSKEVRAVVEERLKRGELPALVATSSLELGIDVGDLDLVALVQTPPTVSSAVQRIGRAGHQVGAASRGLFYPTFPRDILQAAVAARAVVEQDIEEVHPLANPLDVLAQVILSMVVRESWELDALYAFLRASDPYRSLSRRAFDLVVEMLAGRYADSRVRELKARVTVDRVAGTVVARPGAERLLYLSGGTIPDRGYFHLRLKDSMARLGELDEEFVWERSVGDTFTLGAQSWRIRQITHNDVLVTPAASSSSLAPFWRADERDRDAHLSSRVGDWLELADVRLETPEFLATLLRDYCLEEAAAKELVQLLSRQKAATGALPHRRRIVLEWVGERGEDGRRQLILHTLWGGKVNRPFALALAAAWEERHPTSPIEVQHDDDAVLLVVPDETTAEELLELVTPEAVELLLRTKLESTGFFGARFRENAGRALLLPRAGFRHRTPLWLNRQRAKKLLEAVSGYGDFPLIVETWRTCLEDELELGALKERLAALAEGAIAVVEAHTATASPFAAGLVWKQTNTAMYDDDTPLGRGSGLKVELLKELVLSSALRPLLPQGVIDELERKLQRLAPGYAPQGAVELLEWVRERVFLPEEEWRALVAVGAISNEVLAELSSRVLFLRLPGAAWRGVAALENLDRLLVACACREEEAELAGLSGGAVPAPALAALALLRRKREKAEPLEERELSPAAELALEWARFYGPFTPQRLTALFGWSETVVREVVESLSEAQRWVIDRLREASEELELCDAENLETLLRFLRKRSRPSFTALPLARLPLFLAAHQGIARPGDGPEDLKDRLEQLLGFVAPAALWEAEILPVRLSPYYPAWLDALLAESELTWFGAGPERLTFSFSGELDLVRGAAAAGEEAPLLLSEGAADFAELVRRSGQPSAEVTRRLWEAVWQGRVTNESFAALRRGLATKFAPIELESPARGAPQRGLRRRFDRWQASRPFGGAWRALPPPEPPADALDVEELGKERARLLLDRYGIVFRELLAREGEVFTWSAVFRALRLMELSGEVLSGYFFEGIPGPQFMSPGAFRLLERGLPEDASFFLNATDPASPCGLDLDEQKGTFPRRHPTTHLAFQGERLVSVSKRSGRELEIAVPPDHPLLGEALKPLKHLLTREASPIKAIEVETINGEPAAKSAYVSVLGELFSLTRDGAGVRLWKRY